MDKPSGHSLNEDSLITDPQPVPRMTGPSGFVIPDSQCRLEFIVVLFLAVIPDLFSAVSYLMAPTPTTFLYSTGLWLIRSAQIVPVVLYIMWRSGENWERFGIVPIRWFADLAWGVVIYGVLTMGLAFLGAAAGPLIEGLIELGFSQSYDALPAPHGAFEMGVMVAVSLSNGFAEELVMRGFFIPRLDQMLRSRALSVVFSTLLFASYHAYQGPWGLFYALLTGAVYGTLFSWKRRLWPLVVAHALQDLFGFLAL